MAAVTERIATIWNRLAPLPGGAWLFGRLIGWMVPYSGSIRPRVVGLGPGVARVELRDRRRVRNHLRSVHAIALANLGELTSGLAITLALPPGTRGIPVRLEIDYLKKARGRILAEGRASPPRTVTGELDAAATADLTDEAGDMVARMTVTWRLAPDPP